MKRFLPWLVPIVLLLIAIPLLLMVKVASLAKIAGIVMVVLTTVAVRYWLYAANRYRMRGAKVKFTINERYFLGEAFPYYKHMPAAGKKALEERAGLLLAEISFDRYDRKTVGKEECVAFAVVLALAVSDLPYKSCVKKVVVFRKEGNAEMTFQEEMPVLFVGEAELKRALSGINNASAKGNIPAELAHMLMSFYEWQPKA